MERGRFVVLWSSSRRVDRSVGRNLPSVKTSIKFCSNPFFTPELCGSSNPSLNPKYRRMCAIVRLSSNVLGGRMNYAHIVDLSDLANNQTYNRESRGSALTRSGLGSAAVFAPVRRHRSFVLSEDTRKNPVIAAP